MEDESGVQLSTRTTLPPHTSTVTVQDSNNHIQQRPTRQVTRTFQYSLRFPSSSQGFLKLPRFSDESWPSTLWTARTPQLRLVSPSKSRTLDSGRTSRARAALEVLDVHEASSVLMCSTGCDAPHRTEYLDTPTTDVAPMLQPTLSPESHNHGSRIVASISFFLPPLASARASELLAQYPPRYSTSVLPCPPKTWSRCHHGIKPTSKDSGVLAAPPSSLPPPLPLSPGLEQGTRHRNIEIVSKPGEGRELLPTGS